VERHVDILEISMRKAGYVAEVKARGGRNITQWSNLRHAGHETAQLLRVRLHDRIRAKLLDSRAKAAPGQKPIVVIILGPPGSGKTTLAVPFAKKRFRTQFNSVNPDDVKELLPEYEGWNADALHEESSDLAELDIQRHAANRRHNIIYDIVGKTSSKVVRAIENFDALGYRVFVILTDLPSCRFQSNPLGRDPDRPAGRFVPPTYVHETVGNSPLKTFQEVKRHPLVSGYCRLNVDVPANSKPTIVEKKGM
jgi:hypothetical protein